MKINNVKKVIIHSHNALISLFLSAISNLSQAFYLLQIKQTYIYNGKKAYKYVTIQLC